MANIHSKVLGGGIPGAVRLRGKGEMNREEWKASARRCVPKLARASQEKCSCFFQTCHMEQPRLKDSNKERKEEKFICQFLLISVFHPKRLSFYPPSIFAIVLPGNFGHLLQKPDLIPHIGTIHHNLKVVRENIGLSGSSIIRLPADAQPSFEAAESQQ